MFALVLFVAVISASLNLRAGIASVGSVLDQVIDHYDAPAWVGGVVTAVPGTLFFLVGICAVPIARRFGLTPVILAAAGLLTAGLGLRPFAPDVALFLLATVGAAGAIALMNVLLPAWIKQHGGRYIVALTTVYSVTLGLSSAAGPLSALVASSWQSALGLWAITAVVQVVVWGFVLFKFGKDVPGSTASTPQDDVTAPETPVWKSLTAVALMLFFGLQSTSAYIQMGWLPAIFIDAGVAPSTAAAGLGLLGSVGMVGGLVLPTIISRARTLTPLVVLFALSTAAGYLGLYFAPAASPLGWSLLLGFGGCCFPLAIALIPARTRDPLVTARLSGFVQPVGYVLAATGPLLVGVAYDRIGAFQPILIALVVMALVMGAVGVVAARHVIIDDELSAAGR